MNEFVFDNIKHPLKVYYINESGEKVLYKEYLIDTGNEETVSNLMNKREDFAKLSKLKDSEISFDKLKAIMKDSVDSFFGGDFDEIYEKVAKKNIVYMMKFLQYFIEFVNEKAKV